MLLALPASSSLFLGDAATALIRNSGVSVTLTVDKRASARCAGIVTPRVDGLAILQPDGPIGRTPCCYSACDNNTFESLDLLCSKIFGEFEFRYHTRF